MLTDRTTGCSLRTKDRLYEGRAPAPGSVLCSAALDGPVECPFDPQVGDGVLELAAGTRRARLSNQLMASGKPTAICLPKPRVLGPVPWPISW